MCMEVLSPPQAAMSPSNLASPTGFKHNSDDITFVCLCLKYAMCYSVLHSRLPYTAV